MFSNISKFRRKFNKTWGYQSDDIWEVDEPGMIYLFAKSHSRWECIVFNSMKVEIDENKNKLFIDEIKYQKAFWSPTRKTNECYNINGIKKINIYMDKLIDKFKCDD